MHDTKRQEAWAAILAGKNPVSAITRFKRQEATYERRHHWWQAGEFKKDPDSLGATGPRRAGPRPKQRVFTLDMNVEYLYAIGPGGWSGVEEYLADRPGPRPYSKPLFDARPTAPLRFV